MKIKSEGAVQELFIFGVLLLTNFPGGHVFFRRTALVAVLYIIKREIGCESNKEKDLKNTNLHLLYK